MILDEFNVNLLKVYTSGIPCNKIYKLVPIESNRMIQKKESRSYYSISDKESSPVTLNKVAMNAIEIGPLVHRKKIF